MRLERVLHRVRPAGNEPYQVDGVGFGEETQVCAVEIGVWDASFAEDGAEAGVRVLEVGAGVAFEGGHKVHVERIVVDSEREFSISIF